MSSFYTPSHLKCPHCPTTFHSTQAWDEHLVIHDRGKPFKCPHCSYVLMQKCNLKSHLPAHDPEQPCPFTCSQCSKTFTDRQIAISHKKTHDKVKLKQIHECPHCYKRFTWKHNQDFHAWAYDDGCTKYFMCPRCPFSTDRKGDFHHHTLLMHQTALEPIMFLNAPRPQSCPSTPMTHETSLPWRISPTVPHTPSVSSLFTSSILNLLSSVDT